MSTRLLTYRQAADLLACSPRTIARRVHSGLLTVVIDGGMRRIPERELDRYVARRMVKPRSPIGSLNGLGRAEAMGVPRTIAPERVRRLWEGPGSDQVLKPR